MSPSPTRPRRDDTDATPGGAALGSRAGLQAVSTREQHVLDNLGLAYSLAARYRHRGVDLEDLRQVAVVGLLKAVDRFDPDRGVPFAGFAVPTILGELRRHFRDHGWAVRVPRRLQVLRRNADTARAGLEQRLGRSPTLEEVASHLGEPLDDVLMATDGIQSCYRPDSLDEQPRSPGGDDDPAEAACTRTVARDLLAELGDRDRQMMVRRFRDGWTQQQIADEIGLSQMHVSRLLRACIDDLRPAAA